MRLTNKNRPAVARRVIFFIALFLVCAKAQGQAPGQYLGRLSTNRCAADSVSNPYGQYGNRHSPTSVNNPYGAYGSPYSPHSATNPYAISAPRIYGSDGAYLGKLSANRYDPESVSNPYGRYGNPYSPTSINNRYGQYGSPHSPRSARNPYAVSAPIIVSGR